ncbi:unnamed protein product, partial [Closterium sp. Naga37s-1]
MMLLASAVTSNPFRAAADGGRPPVGAAPLRQVAASATPSQARIKLQPSQLQALLALNSEWGAWSSYLVIRLSCSHPSLPTHMAHCRELPNCGLTGSLEILGHLPHLQYVDLSFSGFSGSIPDAIGNATGLQHLDLAEIADLTGSLPSTISRLTALTYLSIGKNQYFVDPEFPEDPPSMLSVMATMSAPVLQGPMAHLSCLAPLTRLRHLALTTLNLTAGELPSSLSALTSLTTLDIKFLSITSTPQWIASLPNLSTMDVTGNSNVHRSAPFPTEWMSLTGLETLRAGLNGFTGSIPSTISALTALTILELDLNNISGSIPDGILNLSRLEYLGLSSNNLTGAVPATRAPLQTLDLSHNHLTNMPTAISPALASLNLSYNDLQGSLPANNIQSLDLSHNPLTEGLDTLIKKSPSLVSLYVGSCNFSGPFQSYPGRVLRVLDVSNNSFSGPFPSVLLNKGSETSYINLSHNNFTRPLPPKLPGTLSFTYDFQTFDISHNRFFGVVPRGIWCLCCLTSLSMAHNQLHGSLPAAPLSLQLRALELQGNAFSGPLPNFASWETQSLHVLDVSDNQLSGSLPDSITRFATLQHLGLGGNNLSGPIPASLGSLVNLTSL